MKYLDTSRARVTFFKPGGNGFEYAALQRLATGEERLREAGIEFWLVGLNPGPLATIQRAPLGETLGDERMFLNIGQAVEAYTEHFGHDESTG